MTTEITPRGKSCAQAAAVPHDGKIRFFRALSFPFLDKPWHWLLNLTLIALLQFVPFLGLIIIQGWSLEVSRRVRQGHSQPLPRWATFWDYLKGWWGCSAERPVSVAHLGCGLRDPRAVAGNLPANQGHH